METVLFVSASKLAKRGITSVRSRVGDVVSLHPMISLENIRNSIKETFCEEYKIDGIQEVQILDEDLTGFLVKYSSDEWNIEKIKGYEAIAEKSFSWGSLRMSFLLDGQRLRAVEIATDAFAADFVEKLKTELNATIDNMGESAVYEFFHSYSEKYVMCREMINDIEKFFFDYVNHVK